ncbi:sugar phosphate isomerase/epimerase and 4-hydroxyphenylpyruvate domain-containing protein [Paractinoplanes lichenicola]|uniref:3-dehydroshikimate dehydratase n=1 Tax=Paractinoplanes lichenicola TaxID=2802976 RepID=A0ABS1VZX5_9ACTN|nr:sugar phosphate isomerase/epimerase and 4-hydroxyphenylpyruvate domain-containing protein [Actinoplanes lichenicola]MBL7260007.1 sugar phosphate isomerase/epimerase and 4-hydroxyphenylpyruvate domain-containing protein [Actinoplanes lichenicola]
MTRTSIATVCLSGTLEDRLEAAAAAGFDAVEIFENDLIASSDSPEDIRRRVADLGLTIDLYQPFRDAEAAPPPRFAAVERRFRAKLDLMARLGTDTILVCSSVAPDTVDDDALAADQLRHLATLAAERGMRIAYEALAWGRHVSTWEHSWEIVRRADHPALGLCLDSFHVLAHTEAYGEIAALPGDRVFFLQLADAPRLDMDVLQWSRHHRLFPLQGRLDLAGFTRAVLATGYAGPLSLEVFNDVFRQADPHRTAVDARRSLIALAADLTPAPHLGGIAFAELGVEPGTGPQLEAHLRTLGFAHTGQHRSKPVQLWEQGRARILLNAGAPTAIRAFALESDDPTASARRASELLAQPLPRRRRESEADLTAVTAPDGTEVFFCKGPAWRGDFLPTGENAAGRLIKEIDHLGLAQPFDRYDEAALFYRSVLGMTDDEAGEFAAPFGLMRTLAIRNEDRSVRLSLSVPLLRRGDWAPAVPHPQHITLLTSDITAIEHTVPIPANYFDDLAARGVRETTALYDEDGHGSYRQLFTPVVGRRVFFEVVQRVGGYRGYGFANDPVRMAAQRHERMASASGG